MALPQLHYTTLLFHLPAKVTHPTSILAVLCLYSALRRRSGVAARCWCLGPLPVTDNRSHFSDPLAIIHDRRPLS
jgi:hypothetical protein